ncbi:ribokinase [Cryobacterium sp. TMT3-29-2]|uniref:ribokinase n=1 Tax=Cryobacterium sp. TMT3-29-2 TaxID=2555867 RepID=UPI0010749E0E|nr:ribokinase [Cryobacterium sp. TMT3-29-2]TFC87551.1 ribokinase [Cryobacterium sp. TMT3-29-2]
MNRIAVLGSATMDLIVRQARLPRPGETMSGSGFSAVPGGAGVNQAVAAARLGAVVDFLGMVGEDVHGAQLRLVLTREGIDHEGLESTSRCSSSSSSEPTGTAHISVVDSGENAIVVVSGANAALTGLSRAQHDTIERAAFLVLQCELPVSVLAEGLAAARSAGAFTVLAPAPVIALPDGFLDLVDLIVPNQHEAAALTGESDPVRAAELLSAGRTWAIVTLGAEGAVVAFDGAVLGLAPARPVQAVDRAAVGDTFVGVLVARLAAGAPRGWAGRAEPLRAGGITEAEMIDAVRWATVAASVSVSRPGGTTSMPTLAEVAAILA